MGHNETAIQVTTAIKTNDSLNLVIELNEYSPDGTIGIIRDIDDLVLFINRQVWWLIESDLRSNTII